jgi:hypothetical protein
LPSAVKHAAVLTKPVSDRPLLEAVTRLVTPRAANVVRLKP